MIRPNARTKVQEREQRVKYLRKDYREAQERTRALRAQLLRAETDEAVFESDLRLAEALLDAAKREESVSNLHARKW